MCSSDLIRSVERLGDFARRNGSSEVNMTLAELFAPEAAGLLSVLDPRFHPGLSSLAIRIAAARNQEDASTYDLVQSSAPPPGEAGGLNVPSSRSNPLAYWENEGMTKKDWFVLLKGLEKRKARLDPPPRDNPRDRPSYLTLRELILTESTGRKAFLVSHWKGRPSGLILLCQLLSKGSLVPEVDTDGDYLEAELDHPAPGLEDSKSKEGEWNLGHGWRVVRENAVSRGRTYRAEAKSGT